MNLNQADFLLMGPLSKDSGNAVGNHGVIMKGTNSLPVFWLKCA